jgi:hypothetical protein
VGSTGVIQGGGGQRIFRQATVTGAFTMRAKKALATPGLGNKCNGCPFHLLCAALYEFVLMLDSTDDGVQKLMSSAFPWSWDCIFVVTTEGVEF